MPNGDIKHDLMDLTVDDLGLWSGLQGKNIAIEVGAFAPAKIALCTLSAKALNHNYKGLHNV